MNENTYSNIPIDYIRVKNTQNFIKFHPSIFLKYILSFSSNKVFFGSIKYNLIDVFVRDSRNYKTSRVEQYESASSRNH